MRGGVYHPPPSPDVYNAGMMYDIVARGHVGLNLMHAFEVEAAIGSYVPRCKGCKDMSSIQYYCVLCLAE